MYICIHIHVTFTCTFIHTYICTCLETYLYVMAPELSVAPRYWTGKQIMFFVAFSCFTRGHRVLDFFVLFRVFSWPRTVFSWPFRVFRGRFRAFVCQFFRVFSCFFGVENAFFVAFSCFFVARSGASIVKGVCR